MYIAGIVLIIYKTIPIHKKYISYKYIQKQNIDGTKCKIWKLKLTKKTTGFKSLRVICWEISQVISKYQKTFWTKLAKKALKQKK